MSLPLLTRAFVTTHEVLDGVQPAELDLPTPCGEYDVRRLLEHLIGWQLVFAACAIDAEPPLADGSPAYLLTGEPGPELRSASMALTANLAGRTQEAITLPYRGTVPVADLVDELVAETVIHTWDLAAGLGRSVEFDPAIIAVAQLGLTKMLAESFAEQGFRAVAGATAGDGMRGLLVRSGRDPGWSVPR
jgi:uncharacterized protein (TIGR03086 family)